MICAFCFLVSFLTAFNVIWAADSDSIDALVKEVQETDAAISALSSEMDETNRQIVALNAEIEKTEQENQNLSAQLSSGKSEMEERIRAMYMYNTDDYFQLLFSSESAAEFFSRADLILSIYKADREQLNQLQSIQSELIANEKQLKADLETVNANMETLFTRENELAALSVERKKKLEDAEIAAAYEAARAAEQKAASETVTSSGTETGSSSVSGSSPSSGNQTETVAADDFDLICAIVRHEGGASYEGSLAVITCVMNRVEVGGWYGSDAVSVLTKPYQFESYFGGYYKQFLGADIPETRQAVRDCMEGGIRSHHYLSFRSTWYFEELGSFPEGVDICGNYYFNPM